MPHLAPLEWLTLPLLFWILLLTTSMIFWWTQFPKISMPKPPSKMSSMLWSWK